MRIIGGSAKGHTLRCPRGMSTRPTSDRVRGAMFSMLEARLPAGMQGLQVLDLYAGTGALALEALSRGAATAVAVDSSSTAQRIILANAVAVGLGAACAVMRMTVQAALDRLGKEDRRFEVVLADPPYAEDADQLLEAIDRAGVLASGALLMLEHSHRGAPGRIPPGLELVVRRRHGDTELSLYGAIGAEP